MIYLCKLSLCNYAPKFTYGNCSQLVEMTELPLFSKQYILLGGEVGIGKHGLPTSIALLNIICDNCDCFLQERPLSKSLQRGEDPQFDQVTV